MFERCATYECGRPHVSDTDDICDQLINVVGASSRDPTWNVLGYQHSVQGPLTLSPSGVASLAVVLLIDGSVGSEIGDPRWGRTEVQFILQIPSTRHPRISTSHFESQVADLSSNHNGN